MRVGFQGDFYSNSYYAAMKYTEQIGESFEGAALINSYPVFEALLKGEIDSGVAAYRNSTAGPVKETEEAFKEFGPYVQEIGEITLPIHHCLFTLPGEENIKSIHSHEQALRQCAVFLNENYPEAKIEAEKDTSLAAYKLASHQYAPGSAVICNRDCGIHYELMLVQGNIETNKDNRTNFKIYKRK